MSAYLDLAAMVCTSSSTWMFVCGRRRAAYCALLVGSVLWTGVAVLGSFGGRPIYGMLIGSANTFLASVLGLYWLRKEDEEWRKDLQEVCREIKHRASYSPYVPIDGYVIPTAPPSPVPPDTRGKDSS